MKDFLGTGWAFPPRLDNRGRVALVTGDEAIARSIKIILGTQIGERVLRPTFGSRLYELVFAPANPSTFGLAEMYVEEALSFWEPRINVNEVTAYIDAENQERICITINYQVKATHDERSLVFPFYRIPGE
jgi:uncharacterized protein